MTGKEYRLIVNKQPHSWPEQFITGDQIRRLAESPEGWVVNQIVPGPGEDPEVGPSQQVDLAEHATPPGEKRFITRKPSTSPGA